MSQATLTTPGSPLTMAALKVFLDAGLDALLTVHRGDPADITSPKEGMLCWDNTGTPDVLKRYTVSAGWITLLTVNVSTGAVTISDLTLTKLATGFTVAGGTTSRTLTVDISRAISDLLLKDGSNLAIGSDADGGIYERSRVWTGGAATNATSRRTLVSPGWMLTHMSGSAYTLIGTESLDLNTSDNWDNSNYATAANRAGKDFYVFACIPSSGTKPDILLSDSATAPAGKTTSNSFLVGGFHCLVADVGTIANHWLTGYLQGDILPRSVWDLKHRPRFGIPRGMVYSPTGHWVDIYLSSIDSGQLASISGAAFVTGDTAVKFHWYKFSQWLGRIGKRMPTQTEFQALSIGSNQGTNIAGSANPVTTGGHSDTAGRRMISNIGCEDCCGVLWQWGDESGAGGDAARANAYDTNDAGVAGQHYLAPNRPLLGGPWYDGAYCGSRGAYWTFGPLFLYASYGVRGLAEPL